MSPVALISLLLAGPLRVSTQQVVTPAAKAAPNAEKLLLVCWFWLAAVAVAALLAWATGAAQRPIAVAAALALSPALVGFALAPRLGGRQAYGVVAVWLGVAGALVALTGGAGSPLVLLLAAGPLLALGLREGSLWPSLGLAGFAWAGAIVFAPKAPAALGIFPSVLALAGLALVIAIAGFGGRPSRARAAMAAHAIAEVSHELRTPLTHILGFSEMIERQIFGPIGERYVEYAGLIRASGAHLLEMVNDLLDLSRIDAGRYELHLEAFDLSSAIEEVVRQFAVSAANKSIALGMTTPDTPLKVRADRRAMRRILINTLGNAIKFTPEGGRVLVSAGVKSGAVELDTIDNGPGIPEAERARLGAAFERGGSGDNVEGAGLGLSLVRALAHLHGGTLSFHEATGGGALVRVTLPILAD
jgi:signal transduction histidine kinase